MQNPVRIKVLNRAGKRCEKCKKYLTRPQRGKPDRMSDRSFHHRVKQSEGGHDSVYCLVALCLRCHRAIHVADDAGENWPQRDGWIVKRRITTAPFLGWRGWVQPTGDGGLTLWDFGSGRTTPLPIPQPPVRPVRRTNRPRR